MDWYLLIPWLTFGALACFVWAISNHLWVDKDELIIDRLKELSGSQPPAGELLLNQSKMAKVVNAAAPSLSSLVQPRTMSAQQDVKRSLDHAGFHSQAAIVLFLACKAICMIIGALCAGSVAFALCGVCRGSLLTSLAGVGAGFVVPGMVLRFLQKRRHKRVFRALPDLLDMLVICVETGQSFDSAIRRLATEFAKSAPELSEELSLYNLHVQMGRARRDALHDLGMRSSVEDLNSLATVLIQADRLGVSIAPAIRELSESVRVKRRQFAEEKAQQTAVKLVIPLVLFIFPGVFVVLVGPAAVMLMRDMMSLQP